MAKPVPYKRCKTLEDKIIKRIREGASFSDIRIADTKQIEQDDVETMANHNVLRFYRQYGLTPELEKLRDDQREEIRKLISE